MNQTDDFLERIRQTEAVSVNTFSRFFTDFKIEPTSSYPSEKSVSPQPAVKIFNPDTHFRNFTLLAIAALLIMVAYKVFHFGERDKVLTVLGYVAIVILTGAVFSAIRDLFYDKTKNYPIKLSAEGIRIGEILYDWKDVCETAILTKYTWGPSKTKYLIIAFNDLKAYEKFDLTYFVNA